MHEKDIHKSHKSRKSVLTPEKHEIIDDFFIERLQNEQINEAEINERYFRLSGLINSAINNIVRVSKW